MLDPSPLSQTREYRSPAVEARRMSVIALAGPDPNPWTSSQKIQPFNGSKGSMTRRLPDCPAMVPPFEFLNRGSVNFGQCARRLIIAPIGRSQSVRARMRQPGRPMGEHVFAQSRRQLTRVVSATQSAARYSPTHGDLREVLEIRGKVASWRQKDRHPPH